MFFSSPSSQATQATQNNVPTPLATSSRIHSVAFKVQQQQAVQYERIKKALAAKIITAVQAKTLNKQVALSFETLESIYHQNKSHKLKAGQEEQVFQLLTNSSHAIDHAVGTTGTQDPS
jgi:hypothetical protein